jgi:Phage integrase family
MKQQTWTKRWKNWVAPTRIPGVWQLKEGGHLVRSRVTDPTTGARREIKKVLSEADEATAYKWLRDEQERIRQGHLEAGRPKTRFGDFAVSLLERKLVTKEIKSARGRERWIHTLRHLIEGTATVPGFGDIYLDEIRPRHIEAWRTGVATLITDKQYAPTTANGWLYILKHVMKRAKRELQLPFNAADGTPAFDTSEHEIYTEEEPNALTSEETAAFLACMKEEFPGQFAMTYLGFATGLRPSSMRPLRRGGSTPDVLWDQGVILVRRSHTLNDEFMKTTKTGLRQRITVPSEIVDVLRWHAQTQLETPEQSESELLFPAEDGGFRSECFLTKAFAEVGRLVGLKKKFTPRGMRRTFNDLARLANVEAVVTKSISGHKTERMREHYSSVQPSEQRESIGRLLRLVKPTSPEHHHHQGCSEGCSDPLKGAPTKSVAS